MKVMFKGYEVEIKAKWGYNTRFNAKDTAALLNTLCCDLSDLAEYLENDKCDIYRACAEYRRKDARELYDALNARGYYDKY